MKYFLYLLAVVKRRGDAPLQNASRISATNPPRVSVLECGGLHRFFSWKLAVAIMLMPVVAARAQSTNLTALLQQGLLEEQANGNINAAIADYRALAEEFDKNRQLAATAVFRLGECYRAQNKTNEAVAQYQRILREFSDEGTLATLSRQNLTGLGVPASPRAPSVRTEVANDEDMEIQATQQLIQNSPDLINDGRLTQAARAGHLRVVTFLLDHGADVNSSDRGGPPLVAAAQSANVEMVKLLLDHGADINARGPSGGTALMGATRRGFLSVVELLIAHKADVNTAYTAMNGSETPLHLAAANGYVNLIKLLLAAGANPNVENLEDRTPLSKAVDNGDPEIIKMLLAAKADPNAGKMDKPLLCAIHQNNTAIAGVLLKDGANPNEGGAEDWDPKWPDHQFRSYSPLWLAVSSSELPLVKLLLEYKADATKIALSQLAHSDVKNATEITALLRQHGAVDNPPNWDRIEVNRLSGLDPFVVFWKGTNDWNHFTLVEAILNYYLDGFGYRHPLPPFAPPNYAETPSPQYFPGSISIPRQRGNTMPFPDLTRVVIVRPSHDSTNETRITVNLGDSPNVIETSKDVPLEFGDMVEIPQRDHSLGESPWWLTENQISSLVNYLHGTAHLAVNGQRADLPLDPWGDASRIGHVLRLPEAQRLLLASSDLSRVKVTRHDPKTGKERQWIVDCTESHPADDQLRLRDGDIIEVPEK